MTATIHSSTTQKSSFMTELKKISPIGVKPDTSLRNWTTFKCEAIAKFIVSPQNLKELQNLVKFLTAEKCDWHVIGRGSNILIQDGGYPGVLIDLSEGFSKTEFQNEKKGKVFVRVEAGVPNGSLLQTLREKELGGFEFAFGIPGSIGGGIRMNAGTPLGWFSDVVREVETVDAKGNFKKFEVTPKDFTYRDFPRGKGLIVTAGVFEFSKADLGTILKKLGAAKEKRANQPLEFPNIGSVFKNPPNDFAGRLIEACGLKGARQGDAEISKKHANFIVNLGRATTQDARALISLAQKTVKQKMGVLLEPEVHVLGAEK